MGERRLTEGRTGASTASVGVKGASKGSSWWEDDPDTILSKKMSDILRHRAKDFGLEMRPDGYVCIRELLKIDRGRFFAGFSERDVVRIVQNNTKVRFGLSEDERAEMLVRANQGHTLDGVEDDSLLVEVRSASELDSKGEICVHGTYWSGWEVIRKEGLNPMGRQHIHFATHAPTDSKEIISGMRVTSEIMIYLDVPKALAAGMKLFRSSNSVLLTRGLGGVVKPEFFSQVVQRFPRKILWPETRPGERRVPGLASAASVKHASTEKNIPTGRETNIKTVNKNAPSVLESWEDEEEENDEEEQEEGGEEKEKAVQDTTEHIETEAVTAEFTVEAAQCEASENLAADGLDEQEQVTVSSNPADQTLEHSEVEAAGESIADDTQCRPSAETAVEGQDEQNPLTSSPGSKTQVEPAAEGEDAMDEMIENTEMEIAGDSKADGHDITEPLNLVLVETEEMQPSTDDTKTEEETLEHLDADGAQNEEALASAADNQDEKETSEPSPVDREELAPATGCSQPVEETEDHDEMKDSAASGSDHQPAEPAGNDQCDPDMSEASPIDSDQLKVDQEEQRAEEEASNQDEEKVPEPSLDDTKVVEPPVQCAPASDPVTDLVLKGVENPKDKSDADDSVTQLTEQESSVQRQLKEFRASQPRRQAGGGLGWLYASMVSDTPLSSPTRGTRNLAGQLRSVLAADSNDSNKALMKTPDIGSLMSSGMALGSQQEAPELVRQRRRAEKAAQLQLRRPLPLAAPEKEQDKEDEEARKGAHAESTEEETRVQEETCDDKNANQEQPDEQDEKNEDEEEEEQQEEEEETAPPAALAEWWNEQEKASNQKAAAASKLRGPEAAPAAAKKKSTPAQSKDAELASEAVPSEPKLPLSRKDQKQEQKEQKRMKEPKQDQEEKPESPQSQKRAKEPRQEQLAKPKIPEMQEPAKQEEPKKGMGARRSAEEPSEPEPAKKPRTNVPKQSADSKEAAQENTLEVIPQASEAHKQEKRARGEEPAEAEPAKKTRKNVAKKEPEQPKEAKQQPEAPEEPAQDKNADEGMKKKKHSPAITKHLDELQKLKTEEEKQEYLNRVSVAMQIKLASVMFEAEESPPAAPACSAVEQAEQTPEVSRPLQQRSKQRPAAKQEHRQCEEEPEQRTSPKRATQEHGDTGAKKVRKQDHRSCEAEPGQGPSPKQATQERNDAESKKVRKQEHREREAEPEQGPSPKRATQEPNDAESTKARKHPAAVVKHLDELARLKKKQDKEQYLSKMPAAMRTKVSEALGAEPPLQADEAKTIMPPKELKSVVSRKEPKPTPAAEIQPEKKLDDAQSATEARRAQKQTAVLRHLEALDKLNNETKKATYLSKIPLAMRIKVAEAMSLSEAGC